MENKNKTTEKTKSDKTLIGMVYFLLGIIAILVFVFWKFSEDKWPGDIIIGDTIAINIWVFIVSFAGISLAQNGWTKMMGTKKIIEEGLLENETSEKLQEVCEVLLTRPKKKFAGVLTDYEVFLNGKEQEKLENGKTVVMQTEYVKNLLSVKFEDGFSTPKAIKFNAISGKTVNIVCDDNELTIKQGDLIQ